MAVTATSGTKSNMPISVKNSGVWTEINRAYIKNSGTWVEPKYIYVKNGGIWKIAYIVTTISASTNDVNLYTLAGSPGTSARYIFVVNNGVVIGSSSTATASMTVSGFPAGSSILLINNGLILGRGGDGAAPPSGGAGNNVPVYGFNGAAGGNAINLGNSLTITNNNIIGGGGGGGAAGGAYWGGPFSYGYVSYNSGGAGGGAGAPGGSGGVWPGLSPQGPSFVAGANGTAGTNSTGGSGGIGAGFYNPNAACQQRGATGGAGGSLGAAGSAPVASTTGCPGAVFAGTSGAAGKAINLNGNTVTWSPQGTVYGAVS